MKVYKEETGKYFPSVRSCKLKGVSTGREVTAVSCRARVSRTAGIAFLQSRKVRTTHPGLAKKGEVHS